MFPQLRVAVRTADLGLITMHVVPQCEDYALSLSPMKHEVHLYRNSVAASQKNLHIQYKDQPANAL
jgi:hypothetical protein